MRRLVEAGGMFVPTSVLPEPERVLRSGYGFAAAPLVRALQDFAGLPGLPLEDPRLAARALDRAEQGLDFAGALHLAAAWGCTAFMSFDRRLEGRGRRGGDAGGGALAVQLTIVRRNGREALAKVEGAIAAWIYCAR